MDNALKDAHLLLGRIHEKVVEELGETRGIVLCRQCDGFRPLCVGQDVHLDLPCAFPLAPFQEKTDGLVLVVGVGVSEVPTEYAGLLATEWVPRPRIGEKTRFAVVRLNE